MDAYLEATYLRVHERLRRYHKLGLAVDVAEGAMLPAFYHAVCVGVETLCIMYHKRELRKMKGGDHV